MRAVHFVSLAIICGATVIWAQDKSQPTAVLLEKKHFSFKYPGNWELVKEDKALDPELDFDPDEYLTIDAEEGGYVTIWMRFDSIKPEAEVASSAKLLARSFEKPVISDFSQYGRYAGKGKIVRGKPKNGTEAFTIRYFICTACEKIFYITEFQVDSKKSSNRSGFQMIEDSFRLK